MTTNTSNSAFSNAANVAVEIPVNNGRPGNNMGIFDDVPVLFEQDFDQHPVSSERLADFEIAGIKTAWNERSVIINTEGVGFDRVFGFSEGRGLLSALSAFHRGQWNQPEVGLYLKKNSGTNFETSNAGYLTCMYQGTDPRFVALKPESGIVRLGYEYGRYFVSDAIPTPGPSPMKGEKDDVTHNRRAYFLYKGADRILLGRKIMVSPQIRLVNWEGGVPHDVTDEEGRPQYDAAATISLIATYAEGYMKSPHDAQTHYEKKMAQKMDNNHAAAVANKLKSGKMRVTIPESDLYEKMLLLADGKTIKVGDMLGKTFVKVRAGVELGTITISSANLLVALAMVERNTKLRLAS